MLCSKREIHTHFVGTFRERRTTIVVQLATTKDRHGRVAEDSASGAERPEIVGLTLNNNGHERWGWKDGDWDDEALVCPAEARGVAVFQRLLWQKLVWWRRCWAIMLRSVRSTMDIDVR